MKEIPLTRNMVAIVDDEDFEYLNQFNWYASKEGKNWYAKRTQHEGYTKDGKQKRRTIRMHRVIAERAGIELAHLIDHKNLNSLDNRRENLRPATHKQNSENEGLRTNNKSGHRGVFYSKRYEKWEAQIMHGGKHIHLGRFTSKNEAIQARVIAEEKYFTHSNPESDKCSLPTESCRTSQNQIDADERLRINNTSGRIGVYYIKRNNNWQANIRHNGKCIHLGTFQTKEEAVEARKKAEEKYYTHSA